MDTTINVNENNEELVTTSKTKLSDLWKKEDWLTVWIGAILIIIASISVLTGAFNFSAAKFATWGNGVSVFEQLAKGSFWASLVRTFLVTGVLFTIGVKLKGESVKKYIPAYAVLFVLAILVRFISAEYTLNRYLEWALRLYLKSQVQL